MSVAFTALASAVLGGLTTLAGAWWQRHRILAEADLTSVAAAERVNTLLTRQLEDTIQRLRDAETWADELERKLRAAEGELERMAATVERLTALLSRYER